VDKKLKITDETIERVKSAKSVVFFTGAGISAESGIPVFRGKNGIWNKLKPEELANFDAFLRNPEMVWEWYEHRKQIIHKSKPNPAHVVIAEIQNYLSNVIVITQNIDNLHKRAGSKIVYELHGNIERNYCIKCKKTYNGDIEFIDGVPKCNCGGLIRPDIVWFGEFLPQDQFMASEIASGKCDVFFIVGTSAVVYPAASLIYTAKAGNAYLIEINIESTEISHFVDESYFGLAGEVLPEIFKKIKN
jgi:NAD-dependent deacetylase